MKQEIKRTRHAPCFEVILICTDAYFRDVQTLNNKLKETHSLIVAHENALKGIDYSKYINDYVPASTNANDRVYEQILKLTTYREMFEAYRGTLKPHIAIICTATHGSLAWFKFIEGWTWDRLSRRYATPTRTLRREADKARADIYSRMPEEYRRYSIPNAEIF